MSVRRRYPVAQLPRESGRLVIDWPDGHHSEYALADVRAACPCAECNSARNSPSSAQDTRATSSAVENMQYVGNYAIQFVWGDGHSYGIYPWELLRRMCPCPICRGGTESE